MDNNKIEKTTTNKTTTNKTTTKSKQGTNFPKPLMVVKDIKKSYGKTEVLRGINFEIDPAERVAIVGANGAGKSTLSEIIAKVKEPSKGHIIYNFKIETDSKGKIVSMDESQSKGEISSNIGIQFQDSSYPDFYKVNDLVNFVISAANIKISAEELDDLYKTFDLDQLKMDVAKGLSGGQQQRLNILLAIVNNPKLLILDEVGTGLDVESRTKIKSYIKSYADKNHAAILLVSHNSDEVTELVNRVIVIHNGEIFEDKSLKEIIAKWHNFDDYMNNLYLNVFKKNLDLRANKTGRQNQSDDHQNEKQGLIKKIFTKKPVSKKENINKEKETNKEKK